MVGPAAAGVVACGGDDSTGDPATPDAATPTGGDAAVSDSGGGTPDATSGPNAIASGSSVYLGHAAGADGSSSTGPAGFTYAWKVTAVPPGSAVTTASLVGAASAKPTFVPDRPGAYELELTVAAGAASSTAKASVAVVDPPVFYFHTEGDAAAGFSASLEVVGAAAGDGGSRVSCFGGPAIDAGYDTLSQQTAKAGADWWEAPPGQASRIVYVFESRESDGGVESILAATTSTASCTTPPTKIEKATGMATQVRAFEQPRLSPSGNRVVYVRNDENGARIATAGFDGATKRTVASFLALPDGGANPDAGLTAPPGARPVWVNETTVAWLQALDGGNWRIVSAPDQASATTTVMMTCTGQAPSQFDILANGEIIVSQYTGSNTAAVTNILAYPITAGTKECGTPRDISKLTSTNGGSFARDFALSPDKMRVAYHANDDTTNEPHILVANVDGTGTPASIASPLNGAYRGPRWVGGGAFVTWGVEGAAFDAGITGNAVAVVAADGGAARAVAHGPEGTTTQAIGNGFWTCSFGPPVGSGIGLFGIAGLAVVRLVRRRRSRA